MIKVQAAPGVFLEQKRPSGPDSTRVPAATMFHACNRCLQSSRRWDRAWSVSLERPTALERRSTHGATRNTQHRERPPDSVQVVLLVRLNHHVRGGLGRACKSKGPALTRPGRLGHQASRASRPTERRESRPSGATAALSQRRPCGRAGVAPAGVQVSTKPAAFWSASRKPQPLTSIVPDTICDEAGGAVSRGAAGGGGGGWRGRVRRVQAWEEGREAR